MIASRLSLAAMSVVLLLALACCGKKGPPEAPGPNDQIIYPRTYPAPDH